jgi:hypothetical protein
VWEKVDLKLATSGMKASSTPESLKRHQGHSARISVGLRRGCDKSMLLAHGRAALVERDRDVIVGNSAIDLALNCMWAGDCSGAIRANLAG